MQYPSVSPEGSRQLCKHFPPQGRKTGEKRERSGGPRGLLVGLGANREMGQVSGGGCSVAAVDSTEHISVPCIKGLQEPKTQPWTRAPDPLSMWNRDPLDDSGVSGASGTLESRVCAAGRIVGHRGPPSQEMRGSAGREAKRPVSMRTSVRTAREDKAPVTSVSLRGGEITQRRILP